MPSIPTQGFRDTLEYCIVTPIIQTTNKEKKYKIKHIDMMFSKCISAEATVHNITFLDYFLLFLRCVFVCMCLCMSLYT